MRILQLAHKSPYPPHEGGPMAMNAIADGLMRLGHTVEVLCMNTPKYNVPLDTIPEAYKKKVNYNAVFVDNRVRIFPAFLNLFSPVSYHVARFVNKAYEKKLSETLQSAKYDVVLLESLYVTPYVNIIRGYHAGPLFLRAHNIEFLIWERLTHNEKNPVKRYYLRYLTKKLKRYEIKIIDSIDGVIAISSVDKIFFDTLKSGTDVIAIPYAIDHAFTGHDAPPVKSVPLFYHLGSMNWLPNLEAVNWLLKKVWPDVVKKIPNAVISIAGRSMPEDIVAFANNSVKVERDIKSVEDYLSDKHVLLAPIFSGSGIRIKILEAMSYGKLVITTATGAEGIDYEDGKDIIIAETAGQFVEKIILVCNNPALITTIGQHARQTITGKYDLMRVSKKLEAFMEGFLL